MHIQIIRRLILTIALLTFIVGSSFLTIDKVNFSGHWTLNKGRTEFGQAPEWVVPKALVVAQKLDEIDIDRIWLDEKGLEHLDKEMLLDSNKVFNNKLYTGKSKGSSINWSEDGQNITEKITVTTIEGQPWYEATEIWSLLDGSPTLLIDRTTK